YFDHTPIKLYYSYLRNRYFSDNLSSYKTDGSEALLLLVLFLQTIDWNLSLTYIAKQPFYMTLSYFHFQSFLTNFDIFHKLPLLIHLTHSHHIKIRNNHHKFA